MRHRWTIHLLAAVTSFGLIVVGCGSGSDGPKLSEQAQLGKELAVRNACVGCHGRNGEGGQTQSGPAWIGLYGSTRELVDGTTVVADVAYLVESIVDPAAKQLAGWGAMPKDDIPPDEVDAMVRYIIELGGPEGTAPSPAVLP